MDGTDFMKAWSNLGLRINDGQFQSNTGHWSVPHIMAFGWGMDDREQLAAPRWRRSGRQRCFPCSRWNGWHLKGNSLKWRADHGDSYPGWGWGQEVTDAPRDGGATPPSSDTDDSASWCTSSSKKGSRSFLMAVSRFSMLQLHQTVMT
jgi:hypothetical protein